MNARFSTVALIAALLAACGGTDTTQDDPQVAADQSLQPTLQAEDGASPDLFVDEIPAAAQLVFVGDDEAIRPGDRPDAVFVPMSTFSVERDGIPNEFPPVDSMAALLESAGVRDGRIVVIGEPIPAGRAYAGLDYLGLGDSTALLDGGPGALPPLNSGDDGARAAPEGAPNADGAGLSVDPRHDMIVDAEWVHDHLDDPDVAILDARPPEQFTGQTPGDGIDRPGHIPGAHNLFWQSLIQSPDQPRLKDESELRRLFQEAGAEPGDLVVAYCRTGGQASFLYTVARHLGYEVRLYDGSFIDWSRTDYPVER